MIKIIEQDTERLIEEVIDIYPEKAKKERKKHLLSNDPECTSSTCQLKSNVKTIPGVMTSRGCAFAGSKGVVWGPIKDMVHISHGPVGCGQYSWWSRRNYYNGKTGIDTFVTMHITSDFQENDIVFGGDKKLEQLCREIKEMFPLAKGITIQCECPVGLIGDDIESVARKMTKELGIPVIPVRCEGFRGISQSLGHHIANDSIRDWVLGKVKGTLEEETPYDVLILGDYNIGGEAWSSRKILEEMGLRVIAQIPGDCTLNELTMLPRPKLILVHCYRSTNYIARYLEENFGIPWIEYNFFGPTKIYESMRKIAKHFDEKIMEKTEKVIEKYKPLMDKVIEYYRPRLEGKKVMLYVGGLRPRHIVGAYEDLGMVVIATGYEFGHRDDYERTFPLMPKNSLIYDDPSHYELEKFTENLKPDLVGSGIKEKYVYHKMGIPFRQMHSWDYSGPYHGFDGFPVFARDMDMAVNNPSWKLIRRKRK
ncbi:nitrogenase molybdenum-iron protein alpha chain [Thermodesulfovibrio aggregans]|uniref:Nitrogenase molybdenum-iron protein alpha chain n=1 Tax=Thermodesulfovibrio aggregans TaxID=86166 RepID=A0A0U9HUJ0_9BACT|nr:nitrogenase molybdenum-iron protein alpha chain [Thermodesulfovibrio aggregans]GAQ95546.1 nitrogenase molybdenum-iron protein alpha chain [Thermodesulfovibrio aggregans]